eukprot:SAG31_NODE_2990_length_4812_cov_6.899215_3_plen_452_part_00
MTMMIMPQAATPMFVGLLLMCLQGRVRAPRAPTAMSHRKSWSNSISTCPCDNPDLCLPISTPRPAKEVLATIDVGPSGYMGNWKTQIDWNVTTILVTGTTNRYGLCGFNQFHDPSCTVNDVELFCHAHASGVRVVPEVAPLWEQSVAKYGRFVNFSLPASRSAYVQRAVTTLVTLGLDGIIFDVEVQYPSFSVPVGQRQGIVELFKETRAAFHTAAPGSLVLSWQSVNSSASIANGLDVAALAAASDAVAIMAYDMYGLACGQFLHAPYPHCGLAGADSPLQWTKIFMRGWLELPAMTPEHFIIVLPAVGFSFDCISGSIEDTAAPPLHCPMQTDGRISYHQAMHLLAEVAANGSLEGPVVVDRESTTSVYNWRQWENTTQQVWIDTADTIASKAAWARDAGFLGVGLYQGTGAYPDNATGSTESLYLAIAENFVRRHERQGREIHFANHK